MRMLPMKYHMPNQATGFVNCFLKKETKFISNTFNHRPISRAQPAVRPEVTEDPYEVISGS